MITTSTIGSWFLRTLKFSGSSLLFSFLRHWENRTATAKFTIRTVLERMKKMEGRDEKQDRLHDINKPQQQQQDTKMTFKKLDIAMKQCFEIKKQQILALKTPPKLVYFYIHLRSQKKNKIICVNQIMLKEFPLQENLYKKISAYLKLCSLGCRIYHGSNLLFSSYSAELQIISCMSIVVKVLSRI